jgi:protease-4
VLFPSLLMSLARAQGLATHHPVVPSAGIAHENGPGAMWVNPANLAYDPDFRYGLFVAQGLGGSEDQGLPVSTGFTLGSQGVNVGVHNLVREGSPGELLSDWSVDYGTSLLLPERVAIGLAMSWNFIDDGANYFAYDAGASWRPLLLVGADVQRLFSTDGVSPDEDQLIATARVRPTEGLYLRANTVVGLEAAPTLVGVGGGLEVYFDGFGGGWHGDIAPDTGAMVQTLMLGSDEPGESLIPSRRQVPTLALDGTPAYQPRTGIFASRQPSWLDTLELLRRLEDDPGVRGLVLHLDGPALSMARAQELRARVEALESAGKPVLVYLDGTTSNTGMLVASGATRVAMHPAGDIQLIGLSAQLITARGLLDWVGVEPQFVKQGAYKSAPEQFTHLEPSEASLAQTHALLDDLQAQLVDAVASGRSVSAEEVQQWVDGGPWAAKQALEAGMVDVLLYEDQLEDELEALHDGSVRGSDLADRPQPTSAWEDPQQVAVIYVEGAITSGESSRGGLLSSASTGSETVVRQLDRAREDQQVRAVVLRVDSPGGSAFASEDIWRAIERVSESEKPVVVSMGSVAASGGYYVAAGADSIWAEPGTVTGSIGVYSGKFATAEVMEKLGVQTTTLARGRASTIDSSVERWDDMQRQRMQELVDETYAMFKQRVADGRGLDINDVQERAQGRVWSGVRAKEQGLVDEVGGLQDAIADARVRAGIPSHRKVGLVSYSPGGGMFETLAPSVAMQLLGPAATWLAPIERRPGLQPLDSLLEDVRPIWLQLQHPSSTVWAMDPWSLQIEGAE